MVDKEFWLRFNLRTSPFFDKPLGAEYPMDLMVGRPDELARTPLRRWEEQEAAAAARAVRDLRDLHLTHGCHFLVEGEMQLTGRIFGRDAQVRDTFSLPTVLLLLGSEAVSEAITHRIEYLRLNPAAGVPLLATSDTIREAHAATRGDLGRAFRALDTAARRRFRTRGAAAGR